ncbi:hypothetical protein EC968_006409 [Mortierella alpina]|nr:hypothetical protein EC968_006409 [Mortierella alpina]
MSSTVFCLPSQNAVYFYWFSSRWIEVGNIEAKRSSATKFEVMSQLRKNIKINKSILLQLEKYDAIECPPLLSIHDKLSDEM